MKIIEKRVLSALRQLGFKSVRGVSLEHPKDEALGDYSTNIAMTLAREKKINPMELAVKIKNILDKDDLLMEVVSNVSVAGGGFVNFYLKKEFLIKKAEKINYEIEFKRELANFGKGRTVVIDYSAPNIAKPFGIGHLRSTNIGQAIYNIYKILGCNCIGDNHLGDWGTQFGKLIAAIKHFQGGDDRFALGQEKDLEKLSIEDLEKLYVQFHQAAEKDESLTEEGRMWFKRLEEGSQEARSIWQKCVDISLAEFRRVYKILRVKIDYAHGEAFYEPKLAGIIETLKKKGIAKKSQGAWVVEFDDMPAAMVKKSNGATTYFTRDLATIEYRIEEWMPDLMIYEVGADQQLHFKQLFRVAEMLGWKPEWQEGLVHVAHGLIRWKEGKFSTRRGDTIHLTDVINKAKERAAEAAESAQIGKDLSFEEKEEMVEAVAIGAIKFSDLSSDPRKDIIFDWDQVMSFSGDSGPYLQYTYARCCSVLGKTKIREQKNINQVPENINKEEDRLLKELSKFEEKIREAAIRYNPSVIATYLLQLARSYNEFYGKHRILEQKEEVWRVFLTKTTASTIEIGLRLLGIEPTPKM